MSNEHPIAAFDFHVAIMPSDSPEMRRYKADLIARLFAAIRETGTALTLDPNETAPTGAPHPTL
jgi:hypothetical protein